MIVFIISDRVPQWHNTFIGIRMCMIVVNFYAGIIIQRLLHTLSSNLDK